MTEGDGVALHATSHPVDEKAEAALSERIVAAMQKAGASDIAAKDYWRVIATAAINEVRLADDEFHEEMEARIEAATETVELDIEIDRWQPIETAKGWPVCLVWDPYFGMKTAWKDQRRGVWMSDGPYDSEVGGKEIKLKPTHWQPLPKPPSPGLSILNNGGKR